MMTARKNQVLKGVQIFMKKVLSLVTIILFAVAFAGCSSVPGIPLQQNGPPAGSVTSGPLDTIPPDSTVEIQVNQKDPIYNTVDVVFAGGRGQIQVSTINVRFTRSDGKSETQQLKPEKGDMVTFQGTNGTDQVEVWVNFYSGKQYKIIDEAVPYRTRG
jgi:hypothetical protein